MLVWAWARSAVHCVCVCQYLFLVCRSLAPRHVILYQSWFRSFGFLFFHTVCNADFFFFLLLVDVVIWAHIIRLEARWFPSFYAFIWDFPHSKFSIVFFFSLVRWNVIDRCDDASLACAVVCARKKSKSNTFSVYAEKFQIENRKAQSNTSTHAPKFIWNFAHKWKVQKYFSLFLRRKRYSICNLEFLRMMDLKSPRKKRRKYNHDSIELNVFGLWCMFVCVCVFVFLYSLMRTSPQLPRPPHRTVSLVRSLLVVFYVLGFDLPSPSM